MEAWAIQGRIRMYEYVDRRQILRYDCKCRKTLERQARREEYGIGCQISLVGSDDWYMVTRNGNSSFNCRRRPPAMPVVLT